MSPVSKAIHLMGGPAKAARELAISCQAVSKWITANRMPAGRVLQVERAIGGRVTRHELRPDLYPTNDRIDTCEAA